MVVVVACGDERFDIPAPDAAMPDALACVEHVDYSWAELDGASPTTPLASFHHSYAYFLACGAYIVAFAEQRRCDDTEGRMLELVFSTDMEDPADGAVLPGTASISGGDYTPLEFHLLRFELGDGWSGRRFSGRFLVTAPGWDLDVNVDVETQFGVSCTL